MNTHRVPCKAIPRENADSAPLPAAAGWARLGRGMILVKPRRCHHGCVCVLAFSSLDALRRPGEERRARIAAGGFAERCRPNRGVLPRGIATSANPKRLNRIGDCPTEAVGYCHLRYGAARCTTSRQGTQAGRRVCRVGNGSSAFASQLRLPISFLSGYISGNKMTPQRGAPRLCPQQLRGRRGSDGCVSPTPPGLQVVQAVLLQQR